ACTVKLALCVFLYSHYSIFKDQKLLSTERRNFNVQFGTERSTLDALSLDTSNRIAVTSLFGGGEGIRTPDPMVANHVLCQLSYTPLTRFRISNFEFRIPTQFRNSQFELL